MGIEIEVKLNYNFVKRKFTRGTNMTDNELQLINLIRDCDNQEEAIITAVETILSYLKQHGSSQEQAVVDLREPA